MYIVEIHFNGCFICCNIFTALLKHTQQYIHLLGCIYNKPLNTYKCHNIIILFFEIFEKASNSYYMYKELSIHVVMLLC